MLSAGSVLPKTQYEQMFMKNIIIIVPIAVHLLRSTSRFSVVILEDEGNAHCVSPSSW